MPVKNKIPILSVEKYTPDNFCLTNEKQRKVSDLFGRRETRQQVMQALKHAFIKLRKELEDIKGQFYQK